MDGKFSASNNVGDSVHNRIDIFFKIFSIYYTS